MSEDSAHYLNDGHIHEVLDRLSVAEEYLEAFLAKHPLVEAVPAFSTDVDHAIEKLAELYQAVEKCDSVSDIVAAHSLVGPGED